MIALTDRLPNPEENPRVIIYTQGHDFAGQQFFDVDALSLYKDSFEHPDDQPEECHFATHWMARPFPEPALNEPIMTRWKQEVLGTTLRVVEDTGEEFTDDVAVLGDCRDPKVQARAKLIVTAPRMRDAIGMVLDADGDMDAIDFNQLREVLDEAGEPYLKVVDQEEE